MMAGIDGACVAEGQATVDAELTPPIVVAWRSLREPLGESPKGVERARIVFRIRIQVC